MAGTLYIVATPIGNLADITQRALDTLRRVAVIYAEDTRVSAKLLVAYDITTPMESFHQHSTDRRVEQVVERLRAGDEVALISDAGTPGINDPGGMLIQAVTEREPDATIVPIPGANAAVAALSIAGVPADAFRYRGFVPQKKGRQTFVRSVAEDTGTQVFYESKHRIVKLVGELAAALAQAGQEDRKLIVARELTKKHESTYRGTAAQVADQLSGAPILGEFVLVVGPYRS